MTLKLLRFDDEDHSACAEALEMLWLQRRGDRACLFDSRDGSGRSGPFSDLIRSGDRPHRPFAVQIHMW